MFEGESAMQRMRRRRGWGGEEGGGRPAEGVLTAHDKLTVQELEKMM